MSLTIKSYKQDDIYIEYRWDKYNGFEVFAGRKINGIIHTIYHNTYGALKDTALRMYRRRVSQARKGELA